VERNPVRAALVDRAEEYPWSMAAAHCGTAPPPGDLDRDEWRRHFTAERWRGVLRVGVAEVALEDRIREATRRGCPLGSDAFVERVSRALGRDLRSRPPRWPPK
jgi:hypothetical protein